MSEEKTTKSRWSELARKVSGKINTAWWLEKLGIAVGNIQAFLAGQPTHVVN